jgi:hypothetical protein
LSIEEKAFDTATFSRAGESLAYLDQA